MKTGKELEIAKTGLFSNEELELIAERINKEEAKYTAKKRFVELTRKTFNVLFALQTEHLIFENITNFQKMLSDIADSLKISIEFKSLVFDKYYFAAIREIKNKAEKQSDLDTYVPIEEFDVLNRHVEEARIQSIDDAKEIEQSRPDYDI